MAAYFFGKHISGVNEPFFVITRLCTIFLVHHFGNEFAPSAVFFWFVLASFLTAFTIQDTSMFRNLLDKIGNGPPPKIPEPRRSLLLALYDLNMYMAYGLQWNNHKRARYRRMSAKHQHVCSQIGYPDRMNAIDSLIGHNYSCAMRVFERGVKKYGVSKQEMGQISKLAEQSERSNYFRVVEALCHLARDWSQTGCDNELAPIIEYIGAHGPQDLAKDDTAVIVPGSGLGRVAHELAALDFKEVHAVEYSYLMTLVNDALYSEDGEVSTETIYPYIHTYSNHFETKDQMRAAKYLHGFIQPDNLTIHTGDFTKFKYEGTASNVLIVTCFFLDTAEDILDYFDAINRICQSFPGKKRWINVGPLKYGSAPRVELSYEELQKLRAALGWRCIHELEKPLKLGYMTDTAGMWQGYYGVGMWTCEKQ